MPDLIDEDRELRDELLSFGPVAITDLERLAQADDHSDLHRALVARPDWSAPVRGSIRYESAGSG
jgi:hypothetical protein